MTLQEFAKPFQDIYELTAALELLGGVRFGTVTKWHPKGYTETSVSMHFGEIYLDITKTKMGRITFRINSRGLLQGDDVTLERLLGDE